MKLYAALLIATLALLTVRSVSASTLPPGDPKIILVGGSGSTDIYGNSFDVTWGSCGELADKCFEGHNLSPEDWSNLALTFSFTPDPDLVSLSCESDLFDTTNCSELSLESGLFTVIFAGTAVNGGIPTDFFFDPPNSDFIIGIQGWGATDPVVTANANVPEPGTMVLMLTGIGGLITRRRFLKRRRVR